MEQNLLSSKLGDFGCIFFTVILRLGENLTNYGAPILSILATYVAYRRFGPACLAALP